MPGILFHFKQPRQLMGYLGLVPSEEISNQSRRQGGITKCGNSHVRWMLAECAQNYRHDPKVSPNLSKRQEGQSSAVKDLSWRAQNRLNQRFRRLSARQLRYNKIIIAVARELSGFGWELYTSSIVPQPSPSAAAAAANAS
ncbi:MAG: transposase [Verrucomicrobiales bacterium]